MSNEPTLSLFFSFLLSFFHFACLLSFFLITVRCKQLVNFVYFPKDTKHEGLKCSFASYSIYAIAPNHRTLTVDPKLRDVRDRFAILRNS